MRVAKITLILDVDSDTEAYDAISEILREQQRDWFPDICLIDYRIDQSHESIGLGPDNYTEGQDFDEFDI